MIAIAVPQSGDGDKPKPVEPPVSLQRSRCRCRARRSLVHAKGAEPNTPVLVSDDRLTGLDGSTTRARTLGFGVAHGSRRCRSSRVTVDRVGGLLALLPGPPEVQEIGKPGGTLPEALPGFGARAVFSVVSVSRRTHGIARGFAGLLISGFAILLATGAGLLPI